MESFGEKKDQAETDCVYTRTGFCEDCKKPPEENCPYAEDGPGASGNKAQSARPGNTFVSSGCKARAERRSCPPKDP